MPFVASLLIPTRPTRSVSELGIYFPGRSELTSQDNQEVQVMITIRMKTTDQSQLMSYPWGCPGAGSSCNSRSARHPKGWHWHVQKRLKRMLGSWASGLFWPKSRTKTIRLSS